MNRFIDFRLFCITALRKNNVLEHDIKNKRFVYYITHVPGKHIAKIEYKKLDDLLVLHHTNVPVALRGKKIGHSIAKEVLDYLWMRKINVALHCPFLIKYVKKHPSPQLNDILEELPTIDTSPFEYSGDITCAQIAASSALDGNKEPVYKLYYGLSLVLQKNMSKGLSTLDSLTNNSVLGLASVLAMIIAHKLFEFPDNNAIKNLELATKDYNLAEDVLFHAANVLILCENFEEAKLYVDRILSDFPSSVHGFLVKGWLELKNNNLKSSRSCFRAVLSQNNDAVGAYLGEVATVELDNAIYMLNQIIVKLPNFLPPLIEKLNMCTRIHDWPQVLESIDRILAIQPNCSVALMTQIMHSIVINGKYDEIPDRFFEVLENSEPCANIFIQWSSALVRVCCQHCGIVNECIRATQIAANMDPSVSNKLELAYQTLLSGQHREAIRLYNDLTNDDEPRPKAIEGIVLCQIAMDEMSIQVEEKISLLNEIRGELKSNELIFMNAMCTSDVNLKTNLIKLAIDKSFNSVENLPYGLEYLTKLNPAMILFFLKYISDNSYKETTLDKLLKICPGLIDCWIMLATVQSANKAYQSLEKVLEMDSTNIDAHLMIANLMIQEGDFSNAAKSLESGLSYNLSIGEVPLYHLLNGLVHKHYERHEECIRAFENALKHLTNKHTLITRDLATLFLSLIQSYCKSDKIDHANTTLQSAYNHSKLKGTEYERDLKLAEANIALHKNNTSDALAILNDISPDQHTYIKAQEIKASIYLKTSQDPVEYAECYKKLVDSHPTIENMINLADAYLKIQESDEAVKVIKNALTLKDDPFVCLKVAKVLVAAHRYTEAINYYNKSGKDGAIDLADLLIKLNQCDMAIKVLGPLPLAMKVMPMSYALEKKGNLEETLDMLKQCSYLENQDVTMRLNILRRSGEIAQKIGKHDLAIGLYKQALVPVEVDSDEANEIKIKLANLYMQVNDWTSCEIICSSLLKDKNNDLALMIIADLSFRRCDFITAKKHFGKLLEKQPTNWAALARLVEVCRRMDSLEELKTTMTVTYKHNNQAGFHYCFGLYCWYTAIIKDAMEHFNLAKNDVEWGQQSLHNMVLICLDEATLNLNLASKLLEDMKPNTPEEQNNLKLLSTFVLLLSKDKQSVEKAMNLFTEMSQESYKIAATLGMAIAFVYQKQAQRARNVLKRVAKWTWQFEEADYLERSWLLLAELYFQSGKIDISVELVKKVLVYNKSSVKGLTLMSAIAEKEQKYDDAVNHYKRAWALCGQKDFRIGYKLAVVLYKTKQYTKSVELCFDLNTTHPEQMKLKKEIFDKARHCLRSR